MVALVRKGGDTRSFILLNCWEVYCAHAPWPSTPAETAGVTARRGGGGAEQPLINCSTANLHSLNIRYGKSGVLPVHRAGVRSVNKATQPDSTPSRASQVVCGLDDVRVVSEGNVALSVAGRKLRSAVCAALFVDMIRY